LTPTAGQVEDEAPYLARAGCWRLDRRRLLNCRRIVFNPAALPPVSPSRLGEDLLTKASYLAGLAPGDRGWAAAWVGFLDDASLLQTLDLSRLTERERTALLLNLHHAMVCSLHHHHHHR